MAWDLRQVPAACGQAKRGGEEKAIRSAKAYNPGKIWLDAAKRTCHLQGLQTADKVGVVELPYI